MTVRVVNNVLRAAVFFMGGDELEGLVDGGRRGGGSSPPTTVAVGQANEPSKGPDDQDATSESKEANADDDNEENMGTERSALEVDEEAQLAEMERVIRTTSIDVWTPYRFEVVGDVHTIERVTTCGQFHRPGERSGLGVTALVSIDLNRATAMRQDAAVVTGPGVAYVSGGSLYLTTTNNGWWGQRRITGGGDLPVNRVNDTDTSAGMAATETGGEAEEEEAFGTESSPLNRPMEQFTQIHRLNIADAGGAARYVASGRVKGMPLNSFSLSEHNGHLRVATTEALFGSEREQTNHVSVLAIEPVENELPLTGSVEDIADGERIYATRFVGDKGFVVTFRQVDPLFTLDLSNPNNPQLIGELKVPGFSTYLHPFESDFLMGIGQSATDEGRVTGMQLSLFDVSDFAAPQLAATHSLGQGSSEALYDHHAFTFWAPTSTLMIPVSSVTEQGDRTGLEIFSVDSESGFGSLGFIDHASIDENGRQDRIRRSMVIGDRVITVGHRGLAATNMGTLESLAHTVFPDPRAQEGHDDGPVRLEPPQPGFGGPGEPDGPDTPEEAPSDTPEETPEEAPDAD